jgi:hypothetical protein
MISHHLVSLRSSNTLANRAVIMSILRLNNIIRHRLGMSDLDRAYDLSPAVIFTILETNIAVVCASIPTFWPVITQLAYAKILVHITNEVTVTSQPRSSVQSQRGGQGVDEGDMDELQSAWDTEWLQHRHQ